MPSEPASPSAATGESLHPGAPLPPSGSASFAARVRSAVAWRWGTQVAAQLITWASTIMVVRLLDPADYGLFAMSQVVITALAFLNGASFATSLVQTAHVDERRIAQMFGLLLVFALLLASVQFIFAPYAAAWFGEPLLTEMLRVQAVIYLTVPFTALPSELLARRLDYRRQGQVNMASAVIGAALALVLAWRGWGVWALVIAPIAMFTVRAVGMTLAAGLRVRPVFDPRGAWDLVTFGGTLTACQLFWIIQSQSDIVIAGRMFDAHDLGLYSEALFLTLIVTGRFIPSINEVALAAYAELHREGKPLAPYYLNTVRMVMLVAAPVYAGLALTSEAAILTLFGPKWAQMAPIVGGLALVMPFFALHLICSPVTNAMGRPKVYLATSIAGAVIMPAAFLWGAHGGFGDGSDATMGLVHAWWVAAPLLCAFTLRATLVRIGVPTVRLLRELVPVLVACAAMAAAVLALQTVVPVAPGPLALARDAAVGAIVYGATLWFGWRHLVTQAWAMLRPREVPPAKSFA
jgi:O-antigen/teichoic acid export membrane protein